MKRTILLFFGGWFFSALPAWACHQGGPMGFASRNMTAFTLDVSLSPTYVVASSSGTSGCKQWSFTMQDSEKFLYLQWTHLAEQASQGEGPHVIAFSRLLGCPRVQDLPFSALLKENYAELFMKKGTIPYPERSQFFLTELHHFMEHSGIYCN